MFTCVFLLGLLLLGGLGGAAASGSQAYGESVQSDNILPRNSNDGTVRKQLLQQSKAEIRRSLDVENYNIHLSPTTSRISLPTIIRLYPPTAKPLHMHANMPMRFGRESFSGDDRAPNSPPNMPQRFGRSWGVTPMCAQCPGVREAPNPERPERSGRKSLYWSLLRTLATAQLLNTGWHWAEDFDLTNSSEELVMEENPFKG